MKLNIVYKKEKKWFIGHMQEYPDYESQGKTVDELTENLVEIYNDINESVDLLAFQKKWHNMQCMQGELATISCALIFKIGVNQQSH